jgi:hypothetical protein
MKTTNLNATLVAVFICLMAILASCVVTPPPYTGEGDPTLNATKTGLRLLSVAATSIQTETGAFQDGVQIKFSEPMLDASVQQALSIYEGEYNPFFVTPQTWQRPTLTSECDGRFKINNPNPFDLSFTWKIMKSVEEGQGFVKANTSAYINTSQGMKMLEIYFNQTDPNASQAWQVREIMSTTPCPIAWSLNWSDGIKGEKQNLFIPNHNFAPGKYTITLSTNARNSGNSIRLETPVRTVITIGTDGKLEGTTEILYPPDPIFAIPPRDPVDPTNPLQVRAELEADAFPPLMTVNESATFDASGSTGDVQKYEWQFCDGTRLEGAIVEKTFNQNGNCSVMLTVTDSSGKADAVVSDVEIMKPMPEIISSSSLHGLNETATYDAGQPIPGLKYEWNVQDKNGAIYAKAEGSKVKVTYPELGSYDVFLSVLDYRDQLNISSAGASRNSRNKNTFRKGFSSSQTQIQDTVTVSSTPLPNTTPRLRPQNTSTPAPTPEEIARDLIDRIVVAEISIETRSANKPKAKLFIIDNGVTRPYGLGRVSTTETKTFTINASNSVGYNLEFTYKICKLVFRGTCTEEIIRTNSNKFEKTFSPGDYTIKLEVKDKWQQLDTAQSYISITDKDKYHVRFSLNLDGRSPRSLSTTKTQAALEKNQATLENKGVQDFSTRARFVEFEAIENKTWYTTSFPFITTEEARIYRAATRWNDWENRMRFQAQLCKQMFSFNNRIPTPANIFVRDPGFAQITFAEDLFYFTGWLVYGVDFVQDTTLCDWTMLITSTGFNKFNSSSDNEQLFSGSWHNQAISVDTVKEFSVPKVLINILPDKILDGKANRSDAETPMLEENTAFEEGNSEEQLFYTVRLRESEMEGGKVTIEIPIYALNEDGELLNANGLFYAKFDNNTLSSDCGDCVMVNGKASIRVTFDPIRFSNQSAFTLDLSRIIMTNDQQNCTASSEYISKNLGMWMWGCLIMNTTNDKPVGLENVTPLPYNFTSDLAAFQGKVMIGETPLQRLQFYGEIATFGLKVVEQLVDFIPVLGSTKAFFAALEQCRTAPTRGQPCDYVSLIFAGVGVVADIIPGIAIAYQGLKKLAPFLKMALGLEKTVANAGLAALNRGKVIATYFRETILPILQAQTPTFLAVFDGLKRFFTGVMDFLGTCVTQCTKNIENGAADLVNAGRTATQATGQVSENAARDIYDGLPGSVRAEYAEFLAECQVRALTPRARVLPLSTAPPITYCQYHAFSKSHSAAKPIYKKYGNGTTSIGINGGELQSHHLLQDKWCKENLKITPSGEAYSSGKAPTIILETGASPPNGSGFIGFPDKFPHTKITNLQNVRQADREARGLGSFSTTLDEELQNTVRDLQAVGFDKATVQQALDNTYKMLDSLGLIYTKITL